MAQEYDNTDRGTLWKNDDKREGHKDPDYRGSINIGGQERWLDCWITEIKRGEKAGRKFLSLKLGKPKLPRGGTTTSTPAKSNKDWDGF